MKPKPLPPFVACITANRDGHTDSWRVEASEVEDLSRQIAAVLAECGLHGNAPNVPVQGNLLTAACRSTPR